MKKLMMGLMILSCCLTSMAQQKMTKEQARFICAQYMAAFTKAVSNNYQKGNSYDQFQAATCAKSQLTPEGIYQLKAAYNFISQGVSSETILRTYGGKEVAASFGYLLNSHKKGIDSDGSELFGGKTGSVNSNLSKSAEGGCRWYQFWCLVQTVAAWMMSNWPGVAELIEVLNLPVISP